MTGRPRNQKIERRGERGSWRIHFYDHLNNKHIHNTKSKNKDIAENILNDINRLQTLSLHSKDPALLNVPSIPYFLYYRQEKPNDIEVDKDTISISEEYLSDNDLQSFINSTEEIKKLRLKVESLEKDRDHYKTLWLSYKDTERAMLIKAYENSPHLNEVIQEYIEKSLVDLFAGGSNDKTTMNRFNNFIKGNPKVSEITPEQILKFLKHWSTGEYKEPKKRYNTLRKNVNRFFNWIHKNYDIPSPMRKVDSMRNVEQGEIEWYDYEELEELLSGLDLYWKAFLSTLAYSGLRKSELTGLRASDVYQEDGKWFIKVIGHQNRSLKNLGTARDVPISKRLLPIITQYLESNHPGEIYLFPALRGNGEMWKSTSFNEALKEVIEIDCRALRRSFNQNLLRDGLSREEIAILSGHSVVVSAKHYARKNAKEIVID